MRSRSVGVALSLAVVLCSALVFCDASPAAESDAEFVEFLEWFESIGGVAPNVGMKRFPGMGSGVLATGPIKELDVVMSVPMEYVACRTSLAAKDDPISKAAVSAKDDEDMVAVWLMAQRGLGAKSDFAPYIKALPEHVPLPVTFTDDELALFESSEVVAGAKKAASSRRARHARLASALRSAIPDATDADYKEFASFERYTWALNLISSRALTIRGRKHLVPFADMFNYQPHTEQRRAESGANFLKYHKLGKEVFQILADRVAQPGEQLFEDYGDNDNGLYMEHHGFVAADNPFDCVDLVLPPLPRRNRLTADKQKLLSAMGAVPGKMDTCARADTGVPRLVHLYLAVHGMTKADLAKCSEIIKGVRKHELLEPCFGSKVLAADVMGDVRVRRKLRDVVADQLKGYSTPSAADERLLRSGGLSEHEHLAISFRHTRKVLLEDLHDKFAKSTSRRKAREAARAKAEAEVVKVAPSAYGETVRGDKELQAVVERFNAWVAASNPPVQAIEAEWVGGGMRIGTMATRDIEPEEIYLSVPDSIIMSRATARASEGLATLLERLDAKYPRGDPFHELLIHLMYEKFVLGSKSHFAPYIDIIPNKAEVGGPIFWSEKDLEELRGSESYNEIIDYKLMMDRRYNAVKGAVFEPNADLLPPAAFTQENFRYAYGILDSRSIWWNGERHLVPLLDLINCVEGPDPTRVHSTVLDESGKYAITRAGWKFPKGSQLFENYGQPNHIYFEYHGFSLDENTHDCVRVRFDADLSDDPEQERKVNALKRYKMRLPATLCVNANKLGDDVRAYLRVVHGATRKTYLKHLAPYAQKQLDRYPTSANEDSAMLADVDALGGVGSHLWTSVRYRLSEKRLLHEALGLPAPLPPAEAAAALAEKSHGGDL